MGTIFKAILKIGKRALTKDGGSLTTITNEVNKWDAAAIGALVVRVLLAVGVLYAAKLTGFSVDQILEVFNEIGN